MIALTAVSMLPWPEIITTGRSRVELLDQVEQLQPVDAPALHPDVEDQQRRLARADRRQRGVGVRGGAHRVALVLTGCRRRVRGCRPRRRPPECHRVMALHVSSTPLLSPARRSWRAPRSGFSGSEATPARAGEALRRRRAEARRRDPPDPLDDGEAKAGALLARGDIGLGQSVAVLRRQADAVVLDLEGRAGLRRATSQRAMRPRVRLSRAASSARWRSPPRRRSSAHWSALGRPCGRRQSSRRSAAGSLRSTSVSGSATRWANTAWRSSSAASLRRELRRRHAGEGRELVDHAADVADLADDGVGAAVEGLEVAGRSRRGTCAAAARRTAGSASAGF